MPASTCNHGQKETFLGGKVHLSGRLEVHKWSKLRNSPSHSFGKKWSWIQQHNCMRECRDSKAGFILKTVR